MTFLYHLFGVLRREAGLVGELPEPDVCRAVGPVFELLRAPLRNMGCTELSLCVFVAKMQLNPHSLLRKRLGRVKHLIDAG